MASKKSWSDLTLTQQKLIIGAGAAETVVTAVALIDLLRRPKEGVRGPKVLWVLAFAVQPVGPFAYFKKGRRRTAALDQA